MTPRNYGDPKYHDVHQVAWTLGRLDYLRRNSQKEIKQSWEKSKLTSRKFYVNSTRRLGKSSNLLSIQLEECIKRPNSRWAFFAPVKDGLLDYIEPIMQETLKHCPETLKPRFDKQRFMLTLPNKSTILFRGSNNQQHRIRRGLDLDGAGVDEARDVDDLKELIDSVIFPALFSSDGYMIISSTPADTFSHDLFHYYQLAQSEGWLYECDIHKAHQLDPEDFPQDRINEWKKETQRDDVWAREYLCQWIIDSTRIAIPEWTMQYAKPYKKDIFYPHYHHYVGIDWGSKDFTAILFATWDFKRAKLVVEAELTFSGSEVRSDKISEAIKETQKKLWENGEIYKMISDSADPILINELNGHGLNCVPVYKEKSLEAMMNQFRLLVNDGKIEVSPTCPMLLSNLKSAVWDKTRTKLDKDPYNHHFDHVMALVYLTRGLVPNENPIPSGFGIDGTRILDMNFDRKKATLSAQALEEAYHTGRKHVWHS